MVAYNNKKYYIDIVESKPANAISIIETDCEVDFAPPLDYKEPERPVAPRSAGKAPEAGNGSPTYLCHFGLLSLLLGWVSSFFVYVCVACYYNWYWKLIIRG